jgi:hypothetical protein
MANQTAIIEGQSFVRKTMTTLVIMSAFLGLAVLGWFANEEHKNPEDLAKLPLIKADTNPFKIKPADPGGMKIPNTDIKLYDEIARNTQPKRTDVIDLSDARLSAPPEEPVTLKEQPVAQPKPHKTVIAVLPASKAPALKPTMTKEENAPVQVVKKPVEEAPVIRPLKPVRKVVISTGPHNIKTSVVSSQDPRYKRVTLSGIPNKPSKIRKTTTPVLVRKTINKPKTIAVSVPAIKRVQKVVRPIKKVTAAPKLMIGSELIQLGSYQSRASVKKGWNTLKKKYPKDLSRLSLSIKTADLGPRGVYYRMLAGPFKNKDIAAKACKKLISKGQDCLVAR